MRLIVRRMIRDRTTAQLLRDYHALMTLFWMAMLPLSLWRGWAATVTFVSAISVWSLVSTEWGAWQASRAEVQAEEVAVEAESANVEARGVRVRRRR